MFENTYRAGGSMTEDIVQEYYKLRDSIIENKYIKLNEEQRKAVLSDDRNLAIIACPGAGKTTTLINRVDYLVNFGHSYKSKYYPQYLNKEDIQLLENYIKGKKVSEERLSYLLKGKGISPGNIIVITFTRAAALNMKKRYIQINSKSGSVPFFGTFHGLFYKILSRKYEKINIIDSYIAFKLIKSVLSNYLDEVSEEKIKEVLNSISLLKVSNISIEEFNPHIDKAIFIQCFTTYEDYKRENKLLDFDDLQIECRNLFINDKKILNSYRSLFKYILVDEFQDCDDMQIEILKLLNNENSVFAVGDEDQCIYGFRGSDPECIVNFDKHFKGGKKLYLSMNYRCPSSVIDISNNLIYNNKMRNKKTMKAFKEDTPKIDVFSYRDEREQSEDISLNILKLVSQGAYAFEDNAILYRTNVESRSIIDNFIRKKIPFRLLDKEYNFFEHFICKDIIAYLKLSIDKYDIESFTKIINKPFRYISKINIEKVKRSSEKEDCFDKLKSIDNIPPFQLNTIDKLKRDIQNLNKMSLTGAINTIIKDLGYYDYLKEYALKYKLSISELEDIVEEFIEASKEYNTIITFLAHIDEVKEQIDNNKKNHEEKGVILSTIHGVKGMEFKNVFIINCNEETIPHKNSIDNNLEEERRLFYVGITRSIDNLWLSMCSEIHGKGRKPSRFIEECKLSTLLHGTFKEGDIIEHKSFGRGKVLFIDEKIIEISFENSIKRSFDPVVLYNNGLIKKYS